MAAAPDRVSFFGNRKKLHIIIAILTVGWWLLVLLAVYMWRTGKRGIGAAAGVAAAVLVLVAAVGSGSDSSSEDSGTQAATQSSAAVEESTPETPSDSTMDRRTREYISGVQACQISVGLVLLEIKRGESDEIEIADTTTNARDNCDAVRSRLASADDDHFSDEALLAWSGVDTMKSGMNALLAYLDNPAPSKLIEARNKIEEGDAQAAEGVRQINQRRVVYGLARVKVFGN